MNRNVLTIGDLEPERPTVTINRTTPDGWWQRWKFNHLDLLLRWFPVRFEDRSDRFPMRLLSELSLRQRQRFTNLAEELNELLRENEKASAVNRRSAVLRQLSEIILDAPADVLDSLMPTQHLAILTTFPTAVTGQTPTPRASANPPTSDASSPASIASTAPGTG